MSSIILTEKKLLKLFKENNCKKKKLKKSLELKKWLREKALNYVLNGKDTIIRLIVGLIKKV